MKTPTWEELEAVVNDESTYQFLTNTPKRYRKAMALALAIARWRPERKEGVRGEGSNALCTYDAMMSDEHLISSCPHCPLSTMGE